MKRSILVYLFTLSLSIVLAQSPREIASSLKFRSIGPAFMTGRIADIVKDPNDKSTWYVAVASGNVWKTTNNGTTWKPIFDDYPVYSTGCLAIDPSNSSTVWLGTGENQSQRSVGWGDGVYRSDDGGKSWKNMGLKESEHIGKILINPTDPDEIIVAAQGPLWRSGGDRGVFLSEDGGKTWANTLKISENTGVADLAMDPTNPNIIYASSYQRRRHVGILVAGGPESRIYKSTDRGRSWTMLTHGLPSGDVGRIALAVSPQKPNVVYAAISSDESRGGFYRSEDYGESWEKKNNYQVVDPQYYGEIYCHPTRFDHVYSVDMMMHMTTDGGESFERVNSRFKHVDNHAIVFDPDDPDYIMVGSDGGIYESWDNTASWKFIDNIPIVQFYRVGVDNEKPFYNVYGGTQDNSTLGGPSQTATRHGITNHDWTLVQGGDGFQARVDPEDPNTVYAQSQYAGIIRYDRKTGTRIDIRPRTNLGDDPLRWHWDSPLIISPHNSKRLYYAAQKVFRSDDRGDSWTLISEDLSRGEDRNQRTVMGKVWQPEAVWKNVFTSPYGAIVSLSESPVKEGLIAIGTDDGQIQISEDGGQSWSMFNKFNGVPDKSYVADLITSNHDVNTLYAVFNNHKEGDFKPYIAKSTNLGKSWQLIAVGIDQTHAGWTIVEDHVDPNLLFFGSEFGLWTSVDGGASWKQMKNGLPTIAVRDIEIQKDETDLVLATFGRGFYILDDYSVLRKQNVAGNHIYPIAKAWIYNSKGNLGYARRGGFGTGFYSADNPAYGAVIRVQLTNLQKSLKSQRNRTSYPSYQTLKSEDTEIRPRTVLAITNSNGDLVATEKLGQRDGFQEVVWSLDSYVYGENGTAQGIASGAGPGNYSAQILGIYNGQVSELTNKVPFEVEMLKASDEQPASDLYEFSRKVATEMMRLNIFQDDLYKKIEEVDRMLNTTVDRDELLKLEENRRDLVEIQYQLEDDPTLRKRSEYRTPGVANRLRVANRRGGTFQITQTHRDQFELASKELNKLIEAFAQVK